MFALSLCPLRVLQISNLMLLIGLGLLFIGLLGAYGLEHQLNMATLVMAHSLTIIGPGLLKLGYVLRLTAQHGLQKREGCCAIA